jgi:A/G-specific adenine glycosylase
VSEIMLQQTQVATVMDYFRRFMQRFPSIQALAESDEDAVLHAWQGLGYYSRARNLRRAAREVVSKLDGTIPSSASELQRLPGVGPYTAGAIASIAFDQAAPILDGNVTRLLCRFFGLRGDPARAPLKAKLWELAESSIPAGEASDFNQAMMEMGALCCTAKSPLCERCPLKAQCRARSLNLVDRLPETAARPVVTDERHVAAVIERRGRYLLLQLGAKAPRWAGLWQFPTVSVRSNEGVEPALRRAARDQVSLDVAPLSLLTVVKHSVTRYRITLDAYRCSAAHGRAAPKGDTQKLCWVRPEQMSGYALPAAHGRIAKHLLSGG